MPSRGHPALQEGQARGFPFRPARPPPASIASVCRCRCRSVFRIPPTERPQRPISRPSALSKDLLSCVQCHAILRGLAQGSEALCWTCRMYWSGQRVRTWLLSRSLGPYARGHIRSVRSLPLWARLSVWGPCGSPVSFLARKRHLSGHGMRTRRDASEMATIPQ